MHPLGLTDHGRGKARIPQLQPRAWQSSFWCQICRLYVLSLQTSLPLRHIRDTVRHTLYTQGCAC